MPSTERSNLSILYKHVDALRPFERNARTHSKRQIRQIADSIREFGFTNPVLINPGDTIVAGHGRVLAAKQIGNVPGTDDLLERAHARSDQGLRNCR